MGLLYWIRQHLRRVWNERVGYRRRAKQNNASNNGVIVEDSDAKPLAHNDEGEKNKESNARSSATDKWIAVFTAILTIATVYQGYLTRTGLEQSGKDTREALGLSRRAAAAAEKQSRATETALNDYNRLATATERQARTSERTAEFSRTQAVAAQESVIAESAGNVKLWAGKIQNWGSDQEPLWIDFFFDNVGKTTIFNAKLSVTMANLNAPDNPGIWKDFKRTFTETIPPGGSEPGRVVMPYVILSHGWADVSQGRVWIVAAARVRFNVQGDPVRHTRYICYAFGGAGGEQSIACPTPPQN